MNALLKLMTYFLITLRVIVFPFDSILTKYIPEGLLPRLIVNSGEVPVSDATTCPNTLIIFTT